MTEDYIEQFTTAFSVALLWSESDDDDQPLDARFSVSDFGDEAQLQIDADCRKFCAENEELLNRAEYGKSDYTDAECAGHDFWLTRRGHGVGFWDRDQLDDGVAEGLTAACKAYSEESPYVGDDGKVYLG